MKKIVLLLVGVLLFIPNLVFADMGAPAVSYKATVINKNGAAVYEYGDEGDKYIPTKQTVKYGTTVFIMYEIGDLVEAEGYGYLKASDIEPVEKDFKVNDKDWSDQTTGLVLKKTDIRKGPAKAYEKIGELNPGETITIIFNVGLDFAETSWAYVDNNKVVGFADTYEGTIAFRPRNLKFMPIYDIKLSGSTIKAGTIMNAKIYDLDDWSKSHYIEYNGKKGAVSRYFLAFEDEEREVTAKRDINIYESLIDETKEEKDFKKIGVLKKGESFKTKYINYEYNNFNAYYYEKGNVKGWIYDVQYDSEGEPKESALSDPTILDEEDATEITDGDTSEPQTTEDVTTSDPTVVPTTPEKKVPTKIYTFIILGVALSLSAIVIILLINRKPKRGRK